ncbi:MAG TPA: CYCXC family (seleno)protein [Candidatus Binataceae bacterium]|nr:CYCXC family (seleno)protein [Candidatus Binataceae bacterium]
MNKSRKKGLLIASGAVAVLAVIYFGASALLAKRNGSVAAGDYHNAMTLDPAMFTGPVHDAYLAAREHPELLAQLHCYCGCDRLHGHTNLLDCFRDNHGGHCAICVGEAVDAARMYKAGTPVDQIRDALRERYHRNQG